MMSINWKFIVSRLFLIGMGTVVGLFFLEGLLRIYPLVPNRFALNDQMVDLWESDDDLLLRLRPNQETHLNAHPEFKFTVQTNALGLRDNKALDDPITIAALGDSFTFGFGVEQDEAWPSYLESLSDEPVLNLGWAGWSSHVYPTTLQRYAIPSGADIWVWAFFVNDLPESASAEDFLAESIEDGYKEEAITNVKLGFPYNIRVLQAFVTLLNPQFALIPGSGDIEFDNGDLSILLSRYAWESSDPNDPNIVRGWELTDEALAEAQALARANDAQLMVAYIPPREQVYWDIVADQMPDMDIEQLNEVAQKLETICQDHDIAFLDLTPGIKARALPDTLLYFAGDGHWNADGHRVAAELIYSELQALNWLPEASASQ